MTVSVPTLTPAELERRREAARSADAHLRLEGLAMTESAKALRERWIRGELSEEELLAVTRAQLLNELCE